MDVHIPQAITEQLRMRGIDVITAQDDKADKFSDEQILFRATQLNRIVFTHDIRFHAMAVAWERKDRHFAGLLYGDQAGVGIGTYVRDLELIAVASDPQDWINRTQRLPFK
jgi:hypothetical protein